MREIRIQNHYTIVPAPLGLEPNTVLVTQSGTRMAGWKSHSDSPWSYAGYERRMDGLEGEMAGMSLTLPRSRHALLVLAHSSHSCHERVFVSDLPQLRTTTPAPSQFRQHFVSFTVQVPF